MFDRQTTADRLFAVAEKCAADALEIAESDYREYMSKLKPGQTVEPMNKLKLYESKQKLFAVCEGYDAEVRDTIARAEREIGDEMAEAPSQAALSYVQALMSRRKVSQAEIDAAFLNYGDNWSIYCALRDFEQAQREAGNAVLFKGGNTLEGATGFLTDTKRQTRDFLNLVKFEAYEGENGLKSRLQWLRMVLNGLAVGRTAAETLASSHEGGATESGDDGAR